MKVQSRVSHRLSFVAGGLALFSMFFGAGDLIWPLILGGASGDKNFFSMMGLLVTGVSLPLMGVLAMMLFQGDYRTFFGRIGRVPGAVLLFVVQVVLGPLGSIPRLITLSYVSLKPYLFGDIGLALFSVLACGVILLFNLRRQRVVGLLGLVLTPALLLCLGAILIIGLVNPPAPHTIVMSDGQAFNSGLLVGYNTLDIIASFMFAPLVLSHFRDEAAADGETDPLIARRRLFRKMVRAALLSAGLLSAMYIGLTYLASFYTQLLPAGHAPEERLSAIAHFLLGPEGGFLSCIAVALACLTTAIPMTAIFADYVQKDLCRNKIGPLFPLLLTLGITGCIANLGFGGIAAMLGPILQVLCPGLIVLSVLNILHKLYEVKMRKLPVFATFALSTVGYLAF